MLENDVVDFAICEEGPFTSSENEIETKAKFNGEIGLCCRWIICIFLKRFLFLFRSMWMDLKVSFPSVWTMLDDVALGYLSGLIA